MKTLNAKRIAAVAAGAAFLAAGIAFAASASGLTYSNIPIINAQGQPYVQVVVGSKAQPSDGVDAGNLAAAIGNLAWTSTPVTTVVNSTKANKLLTVNVANAGSSGSIANGQVWLNQTGKAGVTAGTYTFTALIGSVINEGIQKTSWTNTKSLQASATYAHNETTTYSTALAQPSPYTAYGQVPLNNTITAGSGWTGNGGGVAFSSFSSSTWDNLMQLTNTQFTKLLSNSGTNGESEYLWVSGFPVFSQTAKSFASMDTDVAYQVIFNNPITNTVTNNAINNANFQFLGQTWTFVNMTGVNSGVSSGSFKHGGKIQIASSLVPTQSINVGNTIQSGSFNVTLVDLGQTNSNGQAPAIVNVYYQGALVPHGYQFSIWPGNTVRFNTTTGQTIYVHVNTTSPGLYYYAKSAQLELWSNVYNLTDNTQYNKTVNPGWYVNLLWTNKTSSGTRDWALYSIVIFNKTSVNLLPGQSLPIAQSPSPWSLTFAGDSLGANFDSLNLTLSNAQEQYAGGGTTTTNLGSSLLNITEPQEILTVKSQIPYAFSYGSQKAASVVYDLTPYQLNEAGNVIAANKINGGSVGGAAGSSVGANFIGTGTEIAISYTNAGTDASSWINGNVVMTIKGYTISSSGVVSSANQTTSNTLVTSAGATPTVGLYSIATTFFNVTSLTLNKALPPGGVLAIAVGLPGNTLYGSKVNTLTGPGDTANTLANIISVGAGLLYLQNGATKNMTLDKTNLNNVNYQQYNGEQSVLFTITQKSVTSTGQQVYYTYSVNEIAVPNNVQFDQVQYGFKNSTAGIADGNLFMLNYSGAGQKSNVTYFSTTGQGGGGIPAPEGFRTERGSSVSKVDGASPRTGIVAIAKTEDFLRYNLGTTGSNSATSYTICPSASSTGILVGGSLASCGIANTTVYKISGNVTLGAGASYTIGNLTGLSKAITTQPASVQSVTLLSNLGSTAPLVVLDSNANPSSNLILIGSGYVNSLSAQLQSAQNINISGPSSPSVMQAFSGTGTAGGKILLAGYSAANTTTEVNAFIQWMYNQVASGAGT